MADPHGQRSTRGVPGPLAGGGFSARDSVGEGRFAELHARGNLVEVKGVEHLLRAFQPLCTDDSPQGVSLVIVGDGSLRGALESLAQELGIKDRVLFQGRRPHDEVPLWLNAADVLCLPSLHEGCPNVLLEALACDVRIVASNVGGVPDILDTPDKGWLAKPGDPADLARCLRLALAAPLPRERMKPMSWDQNAEKLYAILNLKGAVHLLRR